MLGASTSFSPNCILFPEDYGMVRSWIRDEVNTDQQPQATIHKSGSAVRDLIGHAPDLVRFIQLYLFDSLHLRQKKRFSHQALDLGRFFMHQDWDPLSTRGIHGLVYKSPNPPLTSPHPTLSIFHFSCIIFTLSTPHSSIDMRMPEIFWESVSL